MMKEVKLTITENAMIANNVVRMSLHGDVSAIDTPGQFINLALPGHFLRRPISVSDVVFDEMGCGGCAEDSNIAENSNTTGGVPAAREGTVTILYKVVGEGTKEMAAMEPGVELDVLTGLGNGFDLSHVKAGQRALLLGGGIGSAPMLMTAKKLLQRNCAVSAVLGFNSVSEVILAEELAAIGVDVTVMTADGSFGNGKGFVTDAEIVKSGKYNYFYACGPMPMLKAVYKACPGAGELSFEERMGCGFGACMGCTMETASGPKRVCKDGPVFERSEILWGEEDKKNV